MKAYAFLILIVFASGCIQGFSSTSGTLKVNEFKFKPSSLIEEQPSLLSLNIKNQGAKSIKEMWVYTYGLSNDWVLSDVNGLEPNEQKFLEMKKIKLNEFVAENKDLNIAGETRVVEWEYFAPKNLPKDVNFDFNVFSRVCYPYSTTSTAQLNIMSKEEYLANIENIKATNLKTTFTKGPLEVKVLSKNPVILNENNEFTVEVELANKEKGYFVKDDCSLLDTLSAENADNLKIKSFDFSVDGQKCETNMDEIYFIAFSNKNTANLIVTCKVPKAATPQRAYILNMNFDYNYFVDLRTTVKVKGQTTYPM